LNTNSKGIVHLACKSILDSFDGIPNSDDRTKVAIITVDSALHFYSISPNSSEAQMLVVADIDDDPSPPLPTDLLVSLSECRSSLESLLERLPSFFANTNETRNCLPAALKVSEKMLGSIGGKIVIIQGSLPNVGDGSLTEREDPKLLGTPKESSLLQPSSNFYKEFTVACSQNQIGVDVFLAGSKYSDVATLSIFFVFLRIRQFISIYRRLHILLP